MDQISAYRLLDETVRLWESYCYTDLVAMIGETISDRVQADDGQAYLLESVISWETEEHQGIRIDLMVSTSDMGPLRRIDKILTIRQH